MIGVMITVALIPVAILAAVQLTQTVTVAQKYAQSVTTRNAMNIIKNYLVANSVDPDNDGWHELLKEATGNTLPLSVPVSQNDQWGTAYRYCTWDLGTANTNATYSQNNVAPPKAQMIGKLISAGADKSFQTACSDVNPSGDDIVVEIYESDARGATGTFGGWTRLVSGVVTLLTQTDMVGIGTSSPTSKVMVVTPNPNDGILLQGQTTDQTARLSINNPAGSWNPIVQNNDVVLSYGQSSANGLSITPWSATGGGLRLDSAGNASVTSTGSSVTIGSTPGWNGTNYPGIQSSTGFIMLNTLPHIPYLTSYGGAFWRAATDATVTHYWDTGLFGDLWEVRRDNTLRLAIDGAGQLSGTGNNGSVRFNSGYGYVDVGPQNTGWAHFITDRPSFYFNTDVTVNGRLVSYGGLSNNGSTDSQFGAFTVRGSKTTWSGLHFRDAWNNASGTLMMSPSYSGFYNAADNGWRWYVDDSGNMYGAGANAAVKVGTGGIQFSDGTIQTSAGVLNGYEVKTNTCPYSFNQIVCTANCSAGKRILGGGYINNPESGAANSEQTSGPITGSPNGWRLNMFCNQNGSVTVYAICAN